MRKQQQGMTVIAMIILVVFVGIIGFGILQLVPVYLEDMRIQQVLNRTKESLDGQNATVTGIRSALSKGVSIESLYDINVRRDFKITRTAEGYSILVDYDREKTFVANVYLLAKFNHSVEIRR